MNPSFTQKYFGTKSEITLVVAMIGILLVLFTPIPSQLLDFLLIVNFSFGLLILLLTFYMDKPLGFSTFPSLLLIATLFRLSLNIAATRLILSDADAGEVIGAVGNYVVGGNYIIGLVVFLILIVVQYVVVTNGSQRVAEVAARFTLDSMPGKQMSIDADLNMGLIDEKQAQKRRKLVEKEASFYGAMDGASKFVKGDAIAGIIIILIDIVGGLTIGLAQKGMSWSDALETYTLLTVGDGIVTQIPALVISTATGIIVTRAATDAFFGEEITNQISRYPKSLIVVGVGLTGLLFLPAIPAFPVLFVLSLVALLAYFAFKQEVPADEDEELETENNDDDLYQQIKVEPIEIVIGKQLIDLVGGTDGIFMEKVKAFRKQLAMEMGFVFPNIQLMDSSKLGANQYQFKIFGSKVSESDLYAEKMLAISAVEKASALPGIATKEPSYGLPAVWIDKEQVANAKKDGYTIVDPMTVLVTHFSELIKNQSEDLLTRSETEHLISRVRQSQPALMEELIPNTMSLGDVQKVLQTLLKEKVSIRNIDLILEALVDKGKGIQDSDELVELVRQRMGRSICEDLASTEGELFVVTLDPALEQSLMGGLRIGEGRSSLLVDPSITEKLIGAIAQHAEKMMADNLQPVLLCSPSLRRHIKRLTNRVLPHLSVLSLTEVPSHLTIKSFGVAEVDSQLLPRRALPQRESNA